MSKNFNDWNILKQKIQESIEEKYVHPREVWWCSLGVNIGSEMDGKNENFERPVLVLQVYNKKILLILPMTTKEKDDEFHLKIESKLKNIAVILTQLRVISSKRLIRKIRILPESEFKKIKEAVKKFI